MYANRREVSLDMHSRFEFFLELLPLYFSLALYRTFTGGLSSICLCRSYCWEVSPTYASRPQVSLDMRSPLESSLGFIAIEVSLWR